MNKSEGQVRGLPESVFAITFPSQEAALLQLPDPQALFFPTLPTLERWNVSVVQDLCPAGP